LCSTEACPHESSSAARPHFWSHATAQPSLQVLSRKATVRRYRPVRARPNRRTTAPTDRAPKSGIRVAVAGLRLTLSVEENSRRRNSDLDSSALTFASVRGLCVHPLVKGFGRLALFLGHRDRGLASRRRVAECGSDAEHHRTTSQSEGSNNHSSSHTMSIPRSPPGTLGFQGNRAGTPSSGDTARCGARPNRRTTARTGRRSDRFTGACPPRRSGGDETADASWSRN
jgi:hypothetical protein